MAEISVVSDGKGVLAVDSGEVEIIPDDISTLQTFLVMSNLGLFLPEILKRVAAMKLNSSQSSALSLMMEAVQHTQTEALSVLHPFEKYNPAMKYLIVRMARQAGTYVFDLSLGVS